MQVLVINNLLAVWSITDSADQCWNTCKLKYRQNNKAHFAQGHWRFFLLFFFLIKKGNSELKSI